MKLRILLFLGATLTFFAPPAQAWHPCFRFGIGIGVPVGPFYGPYYRYGYAYGYPYAYPAPVVVSPPPVVVPQPPPMIYGQAPANPAPTYPPPGFAVPPQAGNEQNVNALLAQLAQPDANARRNAVVELGRMRADRAVDPLTAALAGDMSPQVRDAAARSLALIGSPRALPSLTRAAQADGDRDVRRSAQYAIEVIRSQTR
jgi:HEAT repeats